MAPALLTIVITGASRGLGSAIARQAASLGANLVLSARSVERLRAQAAAIEQSKAFRKAGCQVVIVPGDLSREENCQAVVLEAVERFNSIDAVINNAGVVEPIGPIAEAEPAAWMRAWSINVLGPVMLTRFALPYLRVRQGRVINITSGAAENVIGGWGAYSSSKAAIDLLTRILASEEPAITALSVRPGIIDTDMQATIRSQGANRMAEKNYRFLAGLYEQNRLLHADRPGLAIACLALAAPHEWSGQVIGWDDEAVQRLVQQVTSAGTGASQ